MASVTYGKCIMANVIMAKVFMARVFMEKVLWQMKLSLTCCLDNVVNLSLKTQFLLKMQKK